MTISAFPKIWHLGTPQTERLFNGPVEISEKIDGSQFVFHINSPSEILMRSKGAMIQEDTQDNLFKPVVDWVQSKKGSEMAYNFQGYTFWGETLCKPRHNILAYDRVPKNNFVLFGATNRGRKHSDHTGLRYLASYLDCDVVPLIFQGEVNSGTVLEFVNGLLQQDSYLGGQKIEGVVIKNYSEQLLIGGQFLPLVAGKYVSEAFKEKHKKDWVTTGDVIRDMQLQFKTPARWLKTVQHLRERGELTNSPKDIGPLLKELHVDFEEECREEVKEMLYNHYRKDFLRTLTGGFPEFYKQHLVENMNATG